MTVSEAEKLIQKFNGLKSIANHRQRRYLKFVVPICVSVVTVSYVVSIILDLAINVHVNIDESSTSICGLFGALLPPIIYFHSHFHNDVLLADSVRRLSCVHGDL